MVAVTAVIAVLVVLVGTQGGTARGLERSRSPAVVPHSAETRGVPLALPVPETSLPSPTASPVRSALTRAADPATAAVAAGDQLAAATPGATVGVAVLDRLTGATTIGAAGAAPMYAASLVKIVVALDVLAMRRGGLPVLPSDIDLIRQALGPSDDQAMNALWVRFDGYGAVARVAGRLGLTETRAPQDPAQWGEALTSARDVAALYQHVLTALPAADRDLLIGALAASPPVATDGFDQAFGLLAGASAPFAVSKQGWMCCVDGRITLHSAGLPTAGGRYVVTLLSSVPRAVGYDGARALLTTAADGARGSLT